MNNEEYQLTLDSIATVRTLIDTAIESGQTERAWELSGKHALMARQAASMRAPVVAERMKAEAAVARAAYLASPDQIMRGAAIEQERVRAERVRKRPTTGPSARERRVRPPRRPPPRRRGWTRSTRPSCLPTKSCKHRSSPPRSRIAWQKN